MVTRLLGKKHAQLLLQVLVALATIYIILFLIHSLNCSPTSKSKMEDDNSIPARLKIGPPDKDGRVQFIASFDSKDLLRIWNARANKPATEPPLPTSKVPGIDFILNNETLCKNREIEWIFYVISSPEEFDKRSLLRETWADIQLLKSNPLQVIFLVGTTLDQSIQDRLVAEHKQHGDIVQGDFPDTKKSRALKVLLGMKWISDYCYQAKYALKANDASFINIFGLMSIVKSNFITNQTILCPMWGDNVMPILRDPKKCGEWCVKDDEFPGRTHFPQYCAGVGYVSTVTLLKEMYKASFSTRFFWIEDVYITGLLTKNLAKPVDFINIQRSFSLDIEVIKSQYLGDKGDIEIFICEISDAKLYKQLWKSLINKLPPNWFAQLSDSVIAKNA